MEGESRSVIARAALCVHITRFAATVVNAAKDEKGKSVRLRRPTPDWPTGWHRSRNCPRPPRSVALAGRERKPKLWLGSSACAGRQISIGGDELVPPRLD